MSAPDHPKPDRKRDRLAEIEAMQREADERGRDQATLNAARAQLALLRAHLLKLGVRDLDPDEFGEQAQGNWWINPDTAELRIWFVIDGCAY
jgi:hypothetical protein